MKLYQRIYTAYKKDGLRKIAKGCFDIIFLDCNLPDGTGFSFCVIILFLTVSKNKIAATPENIGVVAILTVVLNYSILFPSFTFFLDGFHLAFGDKFEICIKTTDLM